MEIYLGNVFVDNVGHYRINITNVEQVLSQNVKLFFIMFFQSQLPQNRSACVVDVGIIAMIYSIIFNVGIFDYLGANLGPGEVVGTSAVAKIEGSFLRTV